MVAPSADELAGGASRVEMHVCTRGADCAGSFRFPRFKYECTRISHLDLRTKLLLCFSDPVYLMRSRLGRCGAYVLVRSTIDAEDRHTGEFANLFTLFLRALGLKARYGRDFHLQTPVT